MQVSRENLSFFSALASETRLGIIEILGERTLNIGELAQELGVTSTMIAKHISQLEAEGIVRCENVPGARGIQRLCSLHMFGCVLNMKPERSTDLATSLEIPVGQYTKWSVEPTCGFSTVQSVIGEVDDPRYFADPKHIAANIVWWGRGFLSYDIPNYMNGRQRVKQITLQMEICSEAPGYNESWPSDIYFSINGTVLGFWTSPGDFGARNGVLTPAWWNYGTQYGMLKTLCVNDKGSFIDGIALSDITVDQLRIEYGKPIEFKLESPAEAVNPGGVVLFGRGFGNYDQDIVVTIEYEEGS